MMSRSTLCWVTVLVTAAVFGMTACTGKRASSATKLGQTIGIAKRNTAGTVQGQLLAGGKFDLAQDAGYVTVINFFATWCGPCNAEAPQLDALYREQRSTGLRMIGMDVKDGTQAGSRDWLAAKNISYPVAWDQPAKSAIELGRIPVANLPATVLLDKHQRIAAVYEGPVTPADLTAPLSTLAGES
jgi:thiol-disulfide isomerase/thioredoxin